MHEKTHPTPALIFPTGINSYGVGKHRHMPEIEQGLSEAAGKPVTISFTPHLINMSRGMQTTSYVKMSPGTTVEQLRQHLIDTYANEPFVKVRACLGVGGCTRRAALGGANGLHLAKQWCQ